jgi:proteasome lid subunit RPN8/RPN11
MDPEISFGDVQHVERQRLRRPDENKHFAVVPVFEPDEEELRIYVDIDAIQDMELHALSNTNVELGGVLLGGQYEDEEGRPFVLVSDALRAQHYESTKGSFKFTHDTWSQITRERDEFPDDIQMVGWYHTHPDWGVFLSGMDMFICDNFFNKPLDVALVIDPCRDDRGFFQWTGNPSQRKRRTGGFYLVGSRFRALELEEFAAELEGKEVMARESRSGGYGAPVVNIADRGGAWQAPAIMGMLTVQFCVLAMLVWIIAGPPGEDAASARDKQLAAIERRLEDIAAIRSEQAILDAKREVLDEVIGQVQSAPQGLATALEEERIRAEQLEAAVAGQLAVAREKDTALRRALALRAEDVGKLEQDLKEIAATNEKLKKEKKDLSNQVATYKERLKEYEPEVAEEESDGADKSDWTTYAIWGTVATVFVLVIGALIFFTRQGDEEEMFSEEPSPEPNNPEEPPPDSG